MGSGVAGQYFLPTYEFPNFLAPDPAYGQEAEGSLWPGKNGRLRGSMEPVGPLPRRSSIKGVEFKVSLPKLPALGLN